MAVSCLPTWPLLLFGVLEPIALIWAYIAGTGDPFTFFASQAPNQPIVPTSSSSGLPPQAIGMTLQILNVYLLLAAIAVICSFTTNQATARWYLIAVALADLGHIRATYTAVGPEYFWDVAAWNDMIWGNVGVSVFFNINRWLTVLGAFGALGAGKARKGKRA